MRVIDRVRTGLPHPGPTIVLPEGDDPRIIEAALRAGAAGTCRPLLLGQPDDVASLAAAIGVTTDAVEVLPTDRAITAAHAERYAAARSISVAAASRILRRPPMAAAALVAGGEADAMLAGATSATGEVILAAETIIGRRDGVATTSSFFLIETADGRSFLFADCAVNIDPTPSQLATIAVLTAEAAQGLLERPPKVAFLSFSTKGSAEHPTIDRIREATLIAQHLAPDLAIDGELQADAATDLVTARHKLADLGPVAGRANVLIFPDLEAGNIAYKLVRDLGGATATGVVLQGFRRPVVDVSRGATTDEITDALVLLAVLCTRGRGAPALA